MITETEHQNTNNQSSNLDFIKMKNFCIAKDFIKRIMFDKTTHAVEKKYLLMAHTRGRQSLEFKAR